MLLLVKYIKNARVRSAPDHVRCPLQIAPKLYHLNGWTLDVGAGIPKYAKRIFGEYSLHSLAFHCPGHGYFNYCKSSLSAVLTISYTRLYTS